MSIQTHVQLAGKALVIGLTALALTAGGTALAQQATPPAGTPSATCTVVRVTPEYVGGLIETPEAEAPYTAPTAVPAGTAVDPETAAEVGAFVDLYIACSNSGDLLRALALLEPAYLRWAIVQGYQISPDTVSEVLETLSTPIALTEDQYVRLVGIRRMVLMPDGQVAVVVESDGGPADQPGTAVDLLILRKQANGEWRVSGGVTNVDDSAVPATPSP